MIEFIDYVMRKSLILVCVVKFVLVRNDNLIWYCLWKQTAETQEGNCFKLAPVFMKDALVSS